MTVNYNYLLYILAKSKITIILSSKTNRTGSPSEVLFSNFSVLLLILLYYCTKVKYLEAYQPVPTCTPYLWLPKI